MFDVVGYSVAMENAIEKVKQKASEISFQFVKVPYDIDKELEDEELNIEKENYRYELKQGMYRDMTKINENFRKLGMDVDKI